MLIIEPNGSVLRRLLQALKRECCSTDLLAADWSRQRVHCTGGSCCRIAGRLRQLHDTDLDDVAVMICALDLPDSSGLDALAYVRGVRPDLPVILTGTLAEHDVALEAIRAGASDFVPSDLGGLEALPHVVEKAIAHQRIRHDNERLRRELGRALAETELKHQQLQAVVRQLEVMARTDDLTGLHNRRWLNLALDRAWADAERHGLPLAFAMFDLDGFKLVNDRCGHQQGDRLLRLVARVISVNCRQVDVAARYGGDEFCLLMPHTGLDEAVAVVRRIIEAFGEAVAADRDAPQDVAISCGLAHNRLGEAASAAQLVTTADEALYAAKETAGSRLVTRSAGLLSGEPATSPGRSRGGPGARRSSAACPPCDVPARAPAAP